MFSLEKIKNLFFEVLLASSLVLLVACGGGSDSGGGENDPISINVSLQGSADGVVSSAPTGIDCNQQCQATFDYDSGSILLTATPTGNSVFVEWQGDCQGSTTCTLDSTNNHSVVAVFDIPMVNMTVTRNGTGTGSVISTPVGIDCGTTCQVALEKNSTQLELVANANSGSVFVGWQGDCQGIAGCTLNSDNDHQVTAVFDLVPTINLNLALQGQGGGTVTSAPIGINCGNSCTASFEQNSGVITLTAVANDSSIFIEWLGACQASSGSSCTLQSDQNHNVTAVFEPKSVIQVKNMTLINADTDLPISEHDPLIAGTILDLAAMPTKNLNLRVNVSDKVESVRINVDNTQERIENIEPYALGDQNGDYSQWSLTLGEHTIVATPYSQKNARGEAGQSQTLVFTLSEAQWTFSDERLNLVGAPGGSAPATKTIKVSNTGNLALNYQVANVPAWLTVTPLNGQIVEGAATNLEFTANACTADGRDEANISVTTDKLTQSLSITRICSSTASIDFALDRFYIFQGVPSMDTKQDAADQVTLVVGRPGLGRAFVSASEATDLVPEVVLNYRLSNGTTGQVNLSTPNRLTTKIDEGQLSETFTTELAKTFFVEGLEVFIEVDPDNRLPEIDETNNRLPAVGYYKPKMLATNTFNVTVVPITYNGEPAGDMSEARVRELLGSSWTMHPLNEIDIQIHAPINSSADWGGMLSEVNNLRRAEGSARAYHGIVKNGPGGGTAGIGYVGHLVAVSKPYPGTIAHEFGHNFGLPHAPCGGPASPDPNFPYANARTGVWGYDLLLKTMKKPTLADLMSYCNPTWVSDYNYKKVAQFHDGLQTLRAKQVQQPVSQSVLLVKGSVQSEVLTIDNVFSLNTVALNNEVGPYVLHGFDKTGSELFKQSFKTYDLSHAPISHFSLSVAVSEASLSALHSLQVVYKGKVLLTHHALKSNVKSQLVKPTQAVFVGKKNNQVEIVWDNTRYHAVMVRNPETGEVLGSDQSGRLIIYSNDQSLEVIYSNGLNSTREIIIINN